MNFIGSLVSAEFIRAFAWTLFHSLWQGVLLALIVAGLMTILRKYRPGIRYAILYSMMALLPVFFAGTFLMVYNPGNTGVFSKSYTSFTQVQKENTLMEDRQDLSNTDTPPAWYTHTVQLFEKQAKWMVLLWFAGFFIFLLRFSGSMLYVYRLKNNQLYQVDEQWDTNLRRLSGKMGMRKPVKLAESTLARIPMTIGYLKPVILLPLGTLSGVPPEQIDAILLHELAHILRKDYLLNIFQSVVELMFFYHPVTWWLSGLIRQEREHICDDLAVAVNQDHINYIKALTTMEELNVKSPLLASAIAGSKKKLLCRVKRLLSPAKLRKGFSEGIIAFILVIGLVFTLSFNALSIIPSSYDLSGRESGEKVFNFLPFYPNNLPETKSEHRGNQTDREMAVAVEIPDTSVARSKSGKVIITIYTDSTNQVHQKELDRMAESVDKQAQQYDQAMKEYQIQVQKFEDNKDRIEKECKVVVIKKSDSTSVAGDSVIVIYDDSKSPLYDYRFEYRVPQPGCPIPPHAREFRHLNSLPEISDMGNCRKEIYSIKNDSIDTIIFIGTGEPIILEDIEGLEWFSDEQQDQMKELQLDIERDQGDLEREYRDRNMEYYNLPPVPPEPLIREIAPEHRVASAEKIIRQELRDDGLIVPRKGYMIDLDSDGLYINGEKQSKDVYKKYKRLVESLDVRNIEGGESYRLIF